MTDNIFCSPEVVKKTSVKKDKKEDKEFSESLSIKGNLERVYDLLLSARLHLICPHLSAFVSLCQAKVNSQHCFSCLDINIHQIPTLVLSGIFLDKNINLKLIQEFSHLGPIDIQHCVPGWSRPLTELELLFDMARYYRLTMFSTWPAPCIPPTLPFV